MGYEPLCGRCKEKGHTANTCMAPTLVKQIQIEEFEDSRNVNYVKQTCYDEKKVYITRSQAKAQAKVVPRDSESEHGSDVDFEKPSDKVIKDPKLIKRTWRSQEEVVQAPPIAYLVVSKLEGPLTKIPQDLRLGGMDDEDNRIIMKIALCKTEECLEVIIRSYVLRRNGRVRDSRHREILRDIRNE